MPGRATISLMDGMQVERVGTGSNGCVEFGDSSRSGSFNHGLRYQKYTERDKCNYKYKRMQ